MPNKLQAHAFTIDDDDQSNTHICAVPFTRNPNGIVFICLNGSTCWLGLSHHRTYNIKIAAVNDLGATNSTGEIRFGKPSIFKT